MLDARRFSTDVQRVLFALVANRAVDPLSKLAAAEWASQDVRIDRLAEMDDDQAYRAMDLLADDATIAKVQESVFFAVATLLSLEVDLVLFDTTSTYWECDTEDPDTDDGTTGLRRYGHSKDHRERPAPDRDRPGGDQGRHPGAVLVLAGQHPPTRQRAAAGEGRPVRVEAGAG